MLLPQVWLTRMTAYLRRVTILQKRSFLLHPHLSLQTPLFDIFVQTDILPFAVISFGHLAF